MLKKRIGFHLFSLFLLTVLCHAPAAENHGPAANPVGIFSVLDISERTYHGGPAIAVLLSEPLDPKVRHDHHLRISNPKKMLKSAWVLSDDHQTLWFPHIEPETKYSVSVLESLVSARGNSLNKRVSTRVSTRKITPVASFASEGVLLPSKMTDGLPVVTVNVKTIDVEFFKLNENALTHFVNWKNTTGRKSHYKLRQIRKYGELVFSGRFDLDAQPNKRTICHIPVEDIAPLQNPGVYLAVMRKPGEYSHKSHGAYFLVTDIGLHARIYENESLVTASSLRTGRPLPHVRLTLCDRKGVAVKQGMTDDHGIYRHPEKLTGRIHLIKAAYNDQVSILPLKIPALDMSEFDLGERAHKPREIYVYSPRDLYRPGETVTLSALLRSHDGLPVRSLPIKASLHRPDGREVRTFTWHAQKLDRQNPPLPDGQNPPLPDGQNPPLPDGQNPPLRGAQGGVSEQKGSLNYYQTQLELPKHAQTGLWTLKLWDDPSSKSPANVFEFHLEEFLPERMKLELAPIFADDKTKECFPGPNHDLEVDILGKYLYGAPAAGNELSARVRVRAKRNLSDTLRGFQFGEIKDKPYENYWELSKQTLDDQGRLRLRIPSQWQDIRSPLCVRVIASLFESGGRPVTRNIEQIILPADAVVGIRPLFDDAQYADEGPVGFEVVKIRTDGTLMPAPNMMVELTKEDRDYYWEYSESAGWRRQFTEKNYQFLTNTLTLDGKSPTPYTLHLESGQYVLAITDPQTRVSTSIRFRVGYGWQGHEQGLASHPENVLLTPDKPAYLPGDVIRLMVTPPHDGNALILVEGEHPLWFQRTDVSAAGTQVEIPVSADWDTHNLYISAVVFRPASAKEKITPNRAVGLIHLPLDRSQRKLSLEIDAPEKAASQGPLTVKLKLRNPGDPRPVFATLAAVDVGILNITDLGPPDPFAWFFGPRRYDVNAYDIYAKVIENLDGRSASLRYGGDADSQGMRPEGAVRLVSLFQEPVPFDKNGEAEMTFSLPDFNGRIRLMAVAFSKDKFGSAATEVTVAAPTVTQLAMPRFLAPGDQSELFLDIHNLSGADQDMHVEMDATPPLVLENGRQLVRLADQEKTTLRFPVTASPWPLAASTIRLHLEGEGIFLDQDWKIRTRPGYPAISRKIRKSLRQNETFTLDKALAEDLIPNTVEASLNISHTLPLNIRNAMKGLITYPYGCLEQTIARAYPLLFATPERIAQYDLPRISHEERISRLEKAIERLSAMQLASGGFGLWNKNSPETAWLTAHVTNFMLRARDMGLIVPPKMLKNALDRLNVYLQRGAPLSDYGSQQEKRHLDFAIRAYSGYVLAKVNAAELGTLRTLYDNHRAEAGSGLPLAHLAIALQKMGDHKRNQDALNLAVQKRREQYGYWGDYGSRVRDTALTIGLLIEHQADQTKGFDELLLDLEEHLRNRRWLSTQEKYAIFKAGIALEGQGGQEWDGRLHVGEQETLIHKKGAHLIRLNAADIAKRVTFASETPGFLFTSAIVSGHAKTPPQKDDSQISIGRELYDAQGQIIERNEFKVGELLVAHLTIDTDQWLPDVLVADLLPAGFELENQNLRHSAKLDDIRIEDHSIWRLRENAHIVHEEYRDDRYVAVAELSENHTTHLFYLVRVVSPGKFSVPPPFAESMYRPEIRGIGETPTAITVLNKTTNF